MADAHEATLSPLVEEIAGPISESDPVGADVSYDDDYLALKDQVDQISSVSPEGVDYDRIIEDSRRILAQKSKDLRVATYLALALARTARFRGVMEGILVQKELVERYWEPAYPPLKRMRARQNALQFIAERLTDAVQGFSVGTDDRPFIEEAQEALKSLEAFTMEAMGDQAPVWSGLSKALSDALRKAPKAKEESAPKDDSVSNNGTGTSSSAAPTAPPAEIASPTDALERVLAAARYLRSEKPADPVSYRLTRSILWDGITSEPVSQSGATLFDDPLPHRLTYLNTLSDSKDWSTLLRTAEEAFCEAPLHFLLDLQRFTAAAMDGMGGDYTFAKQAVIMETALLLKRVPALPQLTYANGLPFADPQTKFWIDDVVMPVLASESGDASSADEQELTAQFDEAKRLAAGGEVNKAIGSLQDGMRHDLSGRGRFLRRFQMAQICMQAGKPTVACSILEKLDSELDEHSLHEWEPGLAVDVWSRLHQCYGMLATEDEAASARTKEKARRVFARICEADPSKALEA